MPDRTASVGVLFTDVVGSTRRWEQDPDSMGPLMARHDRVLAGAVEAAGGRVVKSTGDGILAVFPTVAGALGAATAAQHLLHPGPPDGLGLGVRMAVHTGPVVERGGDVFGPTVIRCSRLMDAGHAGQILLSDAASSRIGGIDLTDLGVHHLRDLADPVRVFQAVVPGLPSEFAPLRTLKAFAHNLPTRQTSFVGREMELREIPALLADHRLVTLTGPGGSGKTRLALQVAADVLDRYRDGVWFVDLLEAGPGEDPSRVAVAGLGLAIGVEADPVMAMAQAFAETSTLLVVDNCEHVLDGAAHMARRLLGATATLRILTTSREPLHLEGETIVSVDPLPLPDLVNDPSGIHEIASVRLFEDRAAEVGWSHPDAAVDVAAVCRRLDGMPLAIELAAARLRYMSLDELATSLTVSFDVLRAGHAEDRRHATIRSTITWSYELLAEEHRLMLERLSVFRDGWFRHEAIAVCSAPPLDEALVEDALESLIDRSLVSSRVLDSGMTRFRLLEQVRQFAGERLGETGSVELLGRLIDYYVERSQPANRSLTDPSAEFGIDSAMALTPELSDGIGNLLLVIETALDTGREADAFRVLADGAWQVFWLRSGYFERYLSWLDRALSTVTQHDAVLALGALKGLANCASTIGEPQWLIDLNEQCRRRAIDLGLEEFELESMAGIALGLRRTGWFEESKAMYDEVIQRARERHPLLAMECELFRAHQFEHTEETYRQTRHLLTRIREEGRETIDIDASCLFMAGICMCTGHLEEGLEEAEHALANPLFRIMPVMVSHLEDARAQILAMLGRQAEAEEAATRAIEAGRRLVGPNFAGPAAYQGAALVAEYAGAAGRAQSLLSDALADARRLGVDLHVAEAQLGLVPYLLEREEIDGATAHTDQAEEILGAINRLHDVGPWIQRCRALIACTEGGLSRAARVIDLALPDHPEDAHDLVDVRAGLETAGLVLARAGDVRAVDLFAAIDRWERRAHMVRNPVVERRRQAALGVLAEQPPTQEDLDLDGALELAHTALAEVAQQVSSPASEAGSRT